MPDLTDQGAQLARFLETSGVRLLVAAVLALLAFRAARPLVHRAVVGIAERGRGDGDDDRLALEEARKRVETVEALVSNVLRLAVVVLFAVVALTVFDLLPVVAGLGLFAAALTVAGQDIIRDYIMGVFILLEGQYSKGDVIAVAGVDGTVEDVGLRRTVLRDLSGTVHSVSNGDIRVASNLTRYYARVIVDVTVAFGTDLERVTRIIEEVGLAMADDPDWAPRLLEPPALIRIGAFTELGVPLRVGGRVRAADRFTAAGELRKRLLAALQANQVEIPGVHRFVPVPPAPPAVG